VARSYSVAFRASELQSSEHSRGAEEKCSYVVIRQQLEVYTEVYIVFIYVYLHVIIPYLVSRLLDYNITLLPHL
jgi:hypothetical protein